MSWFFSWRSQLSGVVAKKIMITICRVVWWFFMFSCRAENLKVCRLSSALHCSILQEMCVFLAVIETVLVQERSEGVFHAIEDFISLEMQARERLECIVSVDYWGRFSLVPLLLLWLGWTFALPCMPSNAAQSPNSYYGQFTWLKTTTMFMLLLRSIRYTISQMPS